MNSETDTIAAISTAMNNSGIGIVRISGKDAFSVLTKVFRPADPKKDMTQVPGHTVHYGWIMDGDKIIDEVLVLVMRAPHTYTREDTVEIDCHGGMFVMNKVMEQVFQNGARAAQPGEFTKRAFLNGRIDLSQAEAVIDVINAENEFALESAVTQLKGSVSEKVRQLREILLEQIAFIEAALDDPEHYEIDQYGSTLLPILQRVGADVEKLIETADDGRILKEGIRTVILGKPNAGKSSLLNALLGMDRAIVTQIPGTTRDVLEESIRLGDLTLQMIDTAGIRETEDVIEKIGVEKSKEYARKADLILWMIDSSRPLDEDDREIADMIAGKKTIILMNKQDLQAVTKKEDVAELIVKFKGKLTDKIEENGETSRSIPVIDISAKNSTGLDQFTDCLRHMFYNKDINFNDQVYITNLRQKGALKAALESLKKTMDSINADMPEDFYTIDLMDAYTSLGDVIGETIGDDVADEIFSKFCMGK